MSKVTLLNEDFTGFAIGDFPFETLHGAMGEYHCRPNEWYGGAWYDPIPGKGARKNWIISEIDGKRYIEYTFELIPSVDRLQILAAGNLNWTDCEITADLRMLMRGGYGGLLFRYQNSRCFYSLCFDKGKLRLTKRDYDEVTIISEKNYDYTTDEFYSFKVECAGSSIKCSVNGKLEFDVTDSAYSSGRIGIGALSPAQFTNISVYMESACHSEICLKEKLFATETAKEAEKFSRPLLWRVIDLKNFGCGREIRFGHLTGTKEMFIVLAQCQQRIRRDAFAQISCLTAIDLNGKILWQIGEPNPAHAFLTADLPLQVYDIDGDGIDEVIIGRDFKLQILDGRTGQVKKWIHTPEMEPTEESPFSRLNIDAIRLVDVSGKGRPTDILIKSRYQRAWVYDSELNFLWEMKAGVNTGHFPYNKDINGDGYDEILIGYDLMSHTGEKLWTMPVYTDHIDEIIIGKIDPDRDEIIAVAAGEEGFMLVDLNGNILVRHNVGHAQRVSVGNYRPDLPGLEICVTTYWGNQGLINLYDCKGRLLWSKEPGTNGNIITPVNWSGTGQDLILLNGLTDLGGMIDGRYRQLVRFPDDGHPILAAEAIDLTGDNRDEIILWDEKKMYIYTQEDVLEKETYFPQKYPHYNMSNYRGEFSFPSEQS